MEHLTKEQAIEMYDSEIWKAWTLEENAGWQLYQKYLCVPFSKFHEAMECVLDRPVWTHEFGLSYENLVTEYEGKRSSPSMQDIIELIPEEKRIIVNIKE